MKPRFHYQIDTYMESKIGVIVGCTVEHGEGYFSSPAEKQHLPQWWTFPHKPDRLWELSDTPPTIPYPD